MFNAVLVSALVGLGSSLQLSNAITVVPFETMEQCEFAQDKLDKMTNSFKVKSGEVIPVFGEHECYALPTGNTTVVSDSTTEPNTETIRHVFDYKKHKRWDQ